MPKPHRFETALLYTAGVVQGLALVTFPAASAIFVSPSGFGLTGTEYGAMFIPQVALAILASALSPRLARSAGLRGVLLLGLASDLLSMVLLAISPLLIGSPSAFVLLCVATGALGLGFGATVMALNTLVEALLPNRADAAVLALNALLGLGTALAPVLVSLFSGYGIWWAQPIAMAVLLVALLGAAARASLHAPHQVADKSHGLPPRFWIYAAAVLLYGVAETLCGNWATLYLATERHVSASIAAYALTAFWAMVTLGRVIVAGLARLIPAGWIYAALPVLLAVVFQFVAHADTATMGIAAFAAAGLACSAMLPLSISFSGAEYPASAARMSGSLIAIYQVGYGVAAFGAGSLRTKTGLSYGTIFAAGSVVAVGLAVAAVLIVRGAPLRKSS